MIRNIKHKGLRLLYEKGDKSKLRGDIADKAERFLSFLDEAQDIKGNRTEGQREIVAAAG